MSLLNVTSSGLKAKLELEAKSCASRASGTIKRITAWRIRIRPIVSLGPKFVPQRITFTPVAGDNSGRGGNALRRR